eukprot:gb/GECH01014239.1/.p1 GENE.gb/GECH01014239.1/~~gb/GECH01014239.1/.p1  ORF type:complete len:657 (+),score=169.06 gb/GECH01014239.1/:1-1971(+)
MAEQWKSIGKYYCQYCRTWIANTKPAIQAHETGWRHKNNVKKFVDRQRKEKIQQKRKDREVDSELARIEREAEKKYQQHEGKTTGPPPPSQPPPISSSIQRQQQQQQYQQQYQSQQQQKYSQNQNHSDLQPSEQRKDSRAFSKNVQNLINAFEEKVQVTGDLQAQNIVEEIRAELAQNDDTVNDGDSPSGSDSVQRSNQSILEQSRNHSKSSNPNDISNQDSDSESKKVDDHLHYQETAVSKPSEESYQNVSSSVSNNYNYNNHNDNNYKKNSISSSKLPPTKNDNTKKESISWRQRSHRVVNACSICRRAHRRCDKERPCSRCIKLGHEDTCAKEEYSIPAKKRRRSSKSIKKNNKNKNQEPNFVFENMFDTIAKQQQQNKRKTESRQPRLYESQQNPKQTEFQTESFQPHKENKSLTIPSLFNEHGTDGSSLVFEGYISRNGNLKNNVNRNKGHHRSESPVAFYTNGIQIPNTIEELQEDHTLMLCLAHLKASFPDIKNQVENILQKEHPEFRITNEMILNALKRYQIKGTSVCLDRKKNYIAGSRSSAVLSTQSSSPYLLSWGRALETQWGMSREEIASTPWTSLVHMQSAQLLSQKRSGMKSSLKLNKSIVFMKPVRVLARDKTDNFFEVAIQTTAICNTPEQIWFFTVCWW